MTTRPILAGAVLALASCSASDRDAVPADTTAVSATRVAVAEGFHTPESVLWDADQAAWFVANINGGPTARDNNGYISRLGADGTVDSMRFVAGGRGGVTLNAPKGMAIIGDTLWVTDIDAVRGFNRRTGAPVASVPFGTRAVFLNDLAAGPDGTLYITDSGLAIDSAGRMSHPGPDRVYAIRGRDISTVAEGGWLAGPNGILWDAAGGRLIIVPADGTRLLAWTPGQTEADTLAVGPGGFDGVERTADGRLLVSSWADSTVAAYETGSAVRVIPGLNAPADIGLDPARGWVAVPLFLDDRVEFWTLRR